MTSPTLEIGAPCSVCGCAEYSVKAVLWPELIEQWQLSSAEAKYVNRQQGVCCTQCGANLRSIALANGVRAFFGTDEFLSVFAGASFTSATRILEVNAAGTLSPVLKRFEGHVFAAYPEVDLHALPYETGRFDLVIHSDTLEHVRNPLLAMEECRRVTRKGGGVCFTVPVIVDRLSRRRDGLTRSYHGDPGTASDDLLVHTEFGADVWSLPFRAGFSSVSVFGVDFPSATAFLAIN